MGSDGHLRGGATPSTGVVVAAVAAAVVVIVLLVLLLSPRGPPVAAVINNNGTATLTITGAPTAGVSSIAVYGIQEGGAVPSTPDLTSTSFNNSATATLTVYTAGGVSFAPSTPYVFQVVWLAADGVTQVAVGTSPVVSTPADAPLATATWASGHLTLAYANGSASVSQAWVVVTETAPTPTTYSTVSRSGMSAINGSLTLTTPGNDSGTWTAGATYTVQLFLLNSSSSPLDWIQLVTTMPSA
jgi:uncharacterized protein YaiE (UPF0345 family)